MLVREAFQFNTEVFFPDDCTNSGFNFLNFVNVAQQLRATAEVFTFEFHPSPPFRPAQPTWLYLVCLRRAIRAEGPTCRRLQSSAAVLAIKGRFLLTIGDP